MVGWHHRLNGHGLGWIPGVRDGQGGLACCGSWGRRESDTTEQLNWIELTTVPSGILRCGLLLVDSAESVQSCLTLCDPVFCSPAVSSVMGFPRQEYWSGLSCHPPGDLPNPGIEPLSLMSPALAGGFFTTEPLGKPRFILKPHGENQDKRSPLFLVFPHFWGPYQVLTLSYCILPYLSSSHLLFLTSFNLLGIEKQQSWCAHYKSYLLFIVSFMT